MPLELTGKEEGIFLSGGADAYGALDRALGVLVVTSAGRDYARPKARPCIGYQAMPS